MKNILKKNKFVRKLYHKFIDLKIKVYYRISPKLLTKYWYKKIFKKKINLDNPKTFNEKISWLKLYYYNDKKLVKKCIDKYQVRDYIKEKGLSDILVGFLGVFDDPKEIDFDQLPKKFVLKSTTGSGNNLIVDDKDSLNIEEAKRCMKKWLKEKYEEKYAELQYRDVPNRIVCEEYLGCNISDYKFFCFNGKPKFLYISKGLGKHNDLKIDYCDLDFNSFGIIRGGFNTLEKNEKPKNYNKMLEIVRILSEDFPFVRVDLFNVNGKIYFSELTFVPTAGLMDIKPEKFDYEWGDYLDIDNLIKHKNK